MAIAKRSGDKWFIGVMNNSTSKTVDLDMSFLTAGSFKMETWNDTKKSDKEPNDLKKSAAVLISPGTLKVTMAKNGGFVAIIDR